MKTKIKTPITGTFICPDLAIYSFYSEKKEEGEKNKTKTKTKEKKFVKKVKPSPAAENVQEREENRRKKENSPSQPVNFIINYNHVPPNFSSNTKHP